MIFPSEQKDNIMNYNYKILNIGGSGQDDPPDEDENSESDEIK